MIYRYFMTIARPSLDPPPLWSPTFRCFIGGPSSRLSRLRSCSTPGGRLRWVEPHRVRPSALAQGRSAGPAGALGAEGLRGGPAPGPGPWAAAVGRRRGPLAYRPLPWAHARPIGGRPLRSRVSGGDGAGGGPCSLRQRTGGEVRQGSPQGPHTLGTGNTTVPLVGGMPVIVPREARGSWMCRTYLTVSGADRTIRRRASALQRAPRYKSRSG
jgi:hypothetical protein